MRYEIYQVNIREHPEKAFMPLGGTLPDLRHYDKVYEKEEPGATAEPEAVLEDIFFRFNSGMLRPEGYTGRSVSVSDIVILDGQPWFCDPVGWKKTDVYDNWYN